MKENNDRNRQIKRLQENLSAIRKIAGWTTEELGDKIGVTKQTISNWENGGKMNFTQYIAIRAVLDCEIEENKENEVLAKTVDILLNKSDEFDDETYEETRKTIEIIANVASGGVTGAALTAAAAAVANPLIAALGIAAIAPFGLAGAAVGAAGVVGSVWLKKLLKKKNSKEMNEDSNKDK